MKYKFNEENLLKEIASYINKTYTEHYAKGTEDEIQTFELIAKEPSRGMHFAVGNVIKYGDRFGFKNGMNRADLLKIVHYGLMAMYALDKYQTRQPEDKNVKKIGKK